MHIHELAEKNRLFCLLRFERRFWNQGIKYVAGIDEAGRGPLAGPVVAAAVIFHPGILIPGIDDSKRLSEKQRESLFPVIYKEAIAVHTGIVDEKEIDRINIRRATYKAMKLAVDGLDIQPEHLLVDGHSIPIFPGHQTPIISGDRICFSIAAASIVAKVTRDRIMKNYHDLYPQYGFAQHKGYCTQQHVHALMKYGPCEIHRRSFHVRGWGQLKLS
jgi:ribonuclease HII